MSEGDLYPKPTRQRTPVKSSWLRILAIVIVVLLLLMMFRSLLFVRSPLGGDCYPGDVEIRDPDMFTDIGTDDQGNIYVTGESAVSMSNDTEVHSNVYQLNSQGELIRWLEDVQPRHYIKSIQVQSDGNFVVGVQGRMDSYLPKSDPSVIHMLGSSSQAEFFAYYRNYSLMWLLGGFDIDGQYAFSNGSLYVLEQGNEGFVLNAISSTPELVYTNTGPGRPRQLLLTDSTLVVLSVTYSISTVFYISIIDRETGVTMKQISFSSTDSFYSPLLIADSSIGLILTGYQRNEVEIAKYGIIEGMGVSVVIISVMGEILSSYVIESTQTIVVGEFFYDGPNHLLYYTYDVINNGQHELDIVGFDVSLNQIVWTASAFVDMNPVKLAKFGELVFVIFSTNLPMSPTYTENMVSSVNILGFGVDSTLHFNFSIDASLSTGLVAITSSSQHIVILGMTQATALQVTTGTSLMGEYDGLVYSFNASGLEMGRYFGSDSIRITQLLCS